MQFMRDASRYSWSVRSSELVQNETYFRAGLLFPPIFGMLCAAKKLVRFVPRYDREAGQTHVGPRGGLHNAKTHCRKEPVIILWPPHSCGSPSLWYVWLATGLDLSVSFYSPMTLNRGDQGWSSGAAYCSSELICRAFVFLVSREERDDVCHRYPR